MKQPPKWKMAIIIWLAIYPLITIIFLLFSNQILLIHPMLRTLAITVVVVPIMVFILIPNYTKLFGKWLFK
jgi:antibiotic biosynthesis monooxygenase (ABM) superfamily enzyme